MRLVLASDELTLHGQSWAGFPLLLDDNCEPMEPVQTYLWELLTRNGGPDSRKTWEKYGRDLYDYFAFVHANDVDWTQRPENGLPGPVERYVEWAKGTVGLDRNTIAPRVSLVARFYRWALKTKRIASLPFDEITVSTPGKAAFLSHVQARPQDTRSIDVQLKRSEPITELLTKNQVAACLQKLSNETHGLIFQLIIRSGLRQEEVRTLPEKYIFDPRGRGDLTPGQMVMVQLDPADMKTKGSKERIIEMPYSLMEDLWWWSVRHRPARATNNGNGGTQSALFLTEQGCPYGESSFTSIFNRLAEKVGFSVRPHMGRHTYATYRLISLKRSKTFLGDPLLYLMDRLGHSSVKSTARYLKCVNLVSAELISQHEDELDALFVPSSPNRGSEK